MKKKTKTFFDGKEVQQRRRPGPAARLDRLPLMLASASPRRRELLRAAGCEFRVRPAEVKEIAPTHFTAGEITLFNARAKARAIARLHPDAVVLGVDTVVVFEGEIFGKPANTAAAFRMLARLNGRMHEVYSGVWLRHEATGREHGFINVSRVHFHRRSAAQRRAYLARIGPLDKAGAYAAQDDRGEMIARVEGSMSNVIGLPMEALADAMRDFWPAEDGAPQPPSF